MAFLSTHPIHAGRITELERQIANMPASIPTRQPADGARNALPAPNTDPIASFVWKPLQPSPGGRFEVMDTSQAPPGDRILKYKWYLDGKHYPGNDDARRWHDISWQNQPGSYTLKLEVETSSGKIDTAEATIRIK